MTYARLRTWPQVNQLMGTWQWRQNEWQSNRRFPSPTSTGELKYTFTQIRHSPLAKLRTTISWLRICRFVQLFSLSISRAWLRSAICEGWISRWRGRGGGDDRRKLGKNALTREDRKKLGYLFSIGPNSVRNLAVGRLTDHGPLTFYKTKDGKTWVSYPTPFSKPPDRWPNESSLPYLPDRNHVETFYAVNEVFQTRGNDDKEWRGWSGRAKGEGGGRKRVDGIGSGSERRARSLSTPASCIADRNLCQT